MSTAKTRVEASLYVDDPILAPSRAADYLGRSRRTLNKLHLRRSPMPGLGNKWGYRRSTLNRYLAELDASRSHIPVDDDMLHSL